MHLKESAAVTSASPAKRISTRDLALAGMIAAILTIISQISIPMPTGVPITIQVFGIALVSVVFGWRLGLLAGRRRTPHLCQFPRRLLSPGRFYRRIHLVMASDVCVMRSAL